MKAKTILTALFSIAIIGGLGSVASAGHGHGHNHGKHGHSHNHNRGFNRGFNNGYRNNGYGYRSYGYNNYGYRNYGYRNGVQVYRYGGQTRGAVRVGGFTFRW